MAKNKISLIHILHSSSKYVVEFGVEDHHAREVAAFVGKQVDQKETTPVLIHSEKLTAPKEKMFIKDDTEMWEYYEYPENCHNF